MFPASAFAQSPFDDDGAFDRRRASGRHGRPLRARAFPSNASRAAAPYARRPVLAVEAPADGSYLDGGSVGVDTRPRGVRPRLRPKVVAVAVALVLATTSSLVLGHWAISAADRADGHKQRLDAATTRVDELVAESAEQLSLISQLRARLSEMEDRVTEVRASRVRTVVKTKVVTKQVPRWVPSGTGVEVDTTGFEGRIEIHDVQLTKAYGYSHLIGIAINRSGETISYAQLGCTFVDADGRLLANEMVNKASWAPGQSWGFDCSAQVDGTGGVLRVDDMT